MLNVALTGNVAAGKSTVLRLFEEWGADVIDADRLVREAQRPGSPVLAAIAERFGPDVIRPDGELDRASLRRMVMGDADALEALNAIVHPAVRAERDRRAEAARLRGARVLINDIPLLFETLNPDEFDVVILVDAPEAVRRERLVRDRGLTPDEANRLIASQQPSHEKRERAHIVIDNDGTPEELQNRAREAWQHVLDTSLRSG